MSFRRATSPFISAAPTIFCRRTQMVPPTPTSWAPGDQHADRHRLGRRQRDVPRLFRQHLFVAIFSNTLSAAQIETLWAAGLGGPSIPVITTQPAFATYESMAGGVSPVISPRYGGAGSPVIGSSPTASLRALPTGPPFTSAHFIQPTVVTNGTLLTSVLQATNFQGRRRRYPTSSLSPTRRGPQRAASSTSYSTMCVRQFHCASH